MRLVFVPAGLVKFVFYHWELHAFRDFGIPAPTAMEPLVGALETIGGALVIARRLIVPVAFVLAVIMLVAFVAGGLIHGSPIPKDTLVPALLVAMTVPRAHGPQRRPHRSRGLTATARIAAAGPRFRRSRISTLCSPSSGGGEASGSGSRPSRIGVRI